MPEIKPRGLDPDEQRAGRNMELTTIAFMAGGRAEMQRMHDLLLSESDQPDLRPLSLREETELRNYRILINAWDQGGKEAFLEAFHAICEDAGRCDEPVEAL